MANDTTPNIFCVRGYDGDHGGAQAGRFLKGGYVAIGWFDDLDLSGVENRDELYALYPQYHPEDKSPQLIGQQVGQISRFLFEIKRGDIVVTPNYDPDEIYWGIVENDYVSYEPNSPDGCPFPHRKQVNWMTPVLQRNQLPRPLYYSLGAALTVFTIKHKWEFFEAIGHTDWLSHADKIEIKREKSYVETVIGRILQLNAKEFEILVTALLRTLGFVNAEHKGKSGDYGVDVEGTLNVFGLAKVELVVQVKRYAPSHIVAEREVIALRANHKRNSQLAFITTSDFDKKAKIAASDDQYEPVNLMNGTDFVQLLTEKWDELQILKSESPHLETIFDILKLRRGLLIDE